MLKVFQRFVIQKPETNFSMLYSKFDYFIHLSIKKHLLKSIL